MRSFGGITNKVICWGISAMLGISPMVGIWGAPHAPKFRRCRYSGSPNPTRIRRLFGEPTPSPQYLRWRVFGSCPSPRVYMGSTPCPQCQTLPLFGESEPIQRRKLFGEPTPSPQYLRWRVFGRCPSPKVNMGSAPCPRYNFSFLILHFSLFTFHFSLFISTSHDTEL